jgi:GNAT superfamily N-acetyltransferase
VETRRSWVTEPLDAQHVLTDFDCGELELDRWLRKHALANQRNDASKTRVVPDDQGYVVGFYSLASGSVEYDQAPQRHARGLAKHPIPVVILTRLAVDKRYQGRGVGRFLLRDAFQTIAEISDRVAVRALLIHTKSDNARSWYLPQAEFEEMPGMPSKLTLLIKDLRKAAGKE